MFFNLFFSVFFSELKMSATKTKILPSDPAYFQRSKTETVKPQSVKLAKN